MCTLVDIWRVRHVFIVYMFWRRPEVLHLVGDNAGWFQGSGRGLWEYLEIYESFD